MIFGMLRSGNGLLGNYKTILGIVFLVSSSCSHAQSSLRDLLVKIESASPRVRAATSDQAVAEDRASEAWRRAWTPNFELTYETGVQRYQDLNNQSPPTLSPERTTLRATQLIYDFGRSNHQIGESRSLAAQAAALNGATRDGVLIEAVTAHWSVVRAARVLQYSNQSVASILKQTDLESSMVELGKGYESNVLQAKVQLAGAEARKARAEGALEISQARIGAIFGSLAGNVPYEEVVLPISEKLPKTLEDAIESALKNNKQLLVGVHRSQAINERIAATKAREFFPRLQLVAEHSQRSDVDTAVGHTRVEDQKLMLQLQYNFNMGLAGIKARDSVVAEYEASALREIDTKNLVVEQVSIAWRNLIVARLNRDTLANQVRIAAKFLEMAITERQLGRRSLLDVLTAEVSLINALSDMVSTEADVATAGLTLLQASGTLNFDSVRFEPVSEVLPKIAGM